MARTYRKFIKCGVCAGSNTQYYRYMNRKCRTKNRQSLRNMMANYDIETVSDFIPFGEVPIHDSWREPTDGTFIIPKKDKKLWEDTNSWNHKICKCIKNYLKNKHQKY